MKKLFIYGNGGFGREVSDVALRMNSFDKISFINDFEYDNIEVFNSDFVFNNLMRDSYCEFTVAIGDVATRKIVIERVKEAGGKLASIIDPTAVVSPSASFGDGLIVCQLAFIGPNVNIGKNVIVNCGSIIGHDIVIEDNVVVSSGVKVGGSSIVSDSAYLGMGSIIKEGLRVGQRAVLGMGAVLHSSLDSHMLAIGNPARAIRKVDDDYKIL
jgi:sugar O-acyltransferase (sialic acid O-acetyltransferase NeuD family)